jgi:hypothetical protein
MQASGATAEMQRQGQEATSGAGKTRQEGHEILAFESVRRVPRWLAKTEIGGRGDV